VGLVVGAVSCFFFQAEDGIRDFHVTGVQTCALPIWAGGVTRNGPGDGFAGLDVGRLMMDPVVLDRQVVHAAAVVGDLEGDRTHRGRQVVRGDGVVGDGD